MKRNTVLYWVSTGLLSAMMLFSGYSYFTDPKAIEGFQHLGFPSYFRVELGIAKIIGAIVLVLPFVPSFVKNFTYAGFAIVFTSAIITHISMGDPTANAVAPLVFLIVLAASYFYYHRVSGTSLIRAKN